MRKTNGKIFLYSGLLLLLIAFIIRYLGIGTSIYLFWILFGVAILLKTTFLVKTFSSGFTVSLWLYLILAGVGMIFVSMVFKYIYPVPLLRNILFYSAIALKVAGLILMFVQRKK